jgi:hypothetical protein
MMQECWWRLAKTDEIEDRLFLMGIVGSRSGRSGSVFPPPRGSEPPFFLSRPRSPRVHCTVMSEITNEETILDRRHRLSSIPKAV